MIIVAESPKQATDRNKDSPRALNAMLAGGDRTRASFPEEQKNGSLTAIEEPAHFEETAASPYQDLTLRCLACELPDG
jgi:hypothetical protein